jgi:hypothetical protein
MSEPPALGGFHPNNDSDLIPRSVSSSDNSEDHNPKSYVGRSYMEKTGRVRTARQGAHTINILQ